MTDKLLAADAADPANASDSGNGLGTGGLIHQAVERATQLVSAEITLAKSELTDSIKAGVAALLGGAVAIFAVIAFLVMAVVTVVVAVPLHWIAALSFAAAFLLVGVGAAVFALRRLKAISPLRQTIETVKEDVSWAKQQLKHDAK